MIMPGIHRKFGQRRLRRPLLWLAVFALICLVNFSVSYAAAKTQKGWRRVTLTYAPFDPGRNLLEVRRAFSDRTLSIQGIQDALCLMAQLLTKRGLSCVCPAPLSSNHPVTEPRADPG